MKSALLGLAIVTLAAPTFAGGPVAPAPDPVPEVAPAAARHDWSGFYIGLSYGGNSNSHAIDTVEDNTFDLTNGSLAGAQLGYLFQRGSLVYGAELAYSTYSGVFIPGFTTHHFDHTLDLKARVGFAANRLLAYGVVGYSTGQFTVEFAPNVFTYKEKGTTYGVGVEYAATDRLSIGLEYSVHNLSANAPSPLVNAADLDTDTLTLRVNFKF